MSLKFRKIPFSPPDMSEAEIAQVADTLRSGWITTGPKNKAFERQIAAYVVPPRRLASARQPQLWK